MQPFEYQRVTDPEAAVNAINSSSGAKFLAGGTNLVDLMKQHVELPTHLVDINRLDLRRLNSCQMGAYGSAHWPAIPIPPITHW